MDVKNISIVGLEPAIRGMRNPKDSWKRSDSIIINHLNPFDPEFNTFKDLYKPELLFDKDKGNGYVTYAYAFTNPNTPEGSENVQKIYNEINYNPYTNKYLVRTLRNDYFDNFEGSKHRPSDSDFLKFLEIKTDNIILVGQNDFQLMKNLSNGGRVHRKFARMITVYMDITASFDFWKEYDTYKVGTIANSCSTMHRITKNPISIDNFSKADLRPEDIKFMENNIKYYQSVLDDENLTDVEKTRILSKINMTGFEQTRTVELNYEVLANICDWRRNHKLAEWRYLTNYIFMQLPYFADIFYTNYVDVEKDAQ